MEAKRTKDALIEEIERLTVDKKKISRERLGAVQPIDEKLRLVEDQLKDLHRQRREINASERVEHGFQDEMRQLRDEVDRLRNLLAQATEDSRRNKSEKDDACRERDRLRLKLETTGQHLTNDVTEHRKGLENANEDVVQMRRKGEQNENLRHELEKGSFSVYEREESTARSEAVQSKKEADELRLAWRKAMEELELMRSISEMTQRRQLEQSETFHEILDELKEMITPAPVVASSAEKTSKKSSSSSIHTNDQLVDNDHVVLIRMLYDSLCQRIVALPIAARMFQRGALTLKELESIQSKHECPAKGAETLLNFLLQQPCEVYDYFLEALKLAQQDVYMWLVNSGCVDFAPNVAHAVTIQKHYIFLLETMEAKHSLLIDLLWADGVLSEWERDDIKAGKTPIRRNEKLLSVLSRKSAEQWRLFLDALDNTHQSHIRHTVTSALPVAAARDQKPKPEPRNFGRKPPLVTENKAFANALSQNQQTNTMANKREPDSSPKQKNHKVPDVLVAATASPKSTTRASSIVSTSTVGQPISKIAWSNGPVKAVFGVPLGSCHMSPTHRLVPLVVERCARVVEEKGLENQGIYRVSCNGVSINMMVDELDKDPVNLRPDNAKWQNVYVVSGLLKLFFRMLPDSLMTDALYTTVIQVNKTENSEQRMLKLKKVFHDLPEINFETFRFVAKHLSKVASKGEINKMDARNLAITFGPLLIRPLEVTAMLRDQSDQCRVCQSIILHYEWFFSALDKHLDVPVDE